MNFQAKFSVAMVAVVLLLCAPLLGTGRAADSGTCLNYTDYMHVVASLPVGANHMDQAGDYVYLSSLQVVDVSLPGAPQVVGSFAGQDGDVRGITATELNLYVIYSADQAGFNGLAVYDRTDPIVPTLLATVTMPQFMTQMRVIGDRVYLRNDQGRLLIVDVSNPAAPVASGGIGQGWLDSFDLNGNLLYAVDRINNDVVVVDVTDLDNLQVDYRLNLADVISITFDQGYGYFLSANSGTNILSFTAPDVYTVANDLPALTRPLVVYGDLGYTYGNPLQVYQMASPAAPNLVATVPFIVHSGVLDGDRGLLGISNAFAEMDLSNTEDLPGLAGTVPLANDLSAMIADGDHLVTLSRAGFETYDASDCTAPVALGSIAWQDRLRGHTLAGDYLYVLSDGPFLGRVVLKVFDLSDMSAPQQVATKTLNGDLWGLTAVGDFLYSGEHGALVLINVADPLDPGMFSRTDGVGFSAITAVAGQEMVVADGTMLRHFDVSASDNPVLLTAVDTGVEGTQMLLDSGVAYFVHRGGVKLYEVTQTGAKNMLADLTVPGAVDGAALSEGILYVEGSGIYMLDVSDPMASMFVGNLAYVADRAANLTALGDCLYFDRYISSDRGLLNIAHRYCATDGPTGPQVVIDIKPGSEINPINCRNGHGVIPVAILTTADFDALSVDHNTVRFGPGEASETHRNHGHGRGHHQGCHEGELKRHEEDVDGDGDIDLVFHFARDEADIACGDTEAWLTGETYNGESFTASDVVWTRPIDGDDDGCHGRGGHKVLSERPTLALVPNPFNPQTTVTFSLPQSVRLRVEVYDLTGRRIAVVADEVFGAGANRVIWQGDNSSGRPVASGVYFVRLTGPGVELNQRAVLLK